MEKKRGVGTQKLKKEGGGGGSKLGQGVGALKRRAGTPTMMIVITIIKLHNDKNKFLFPLIFICNNNTVTTATMNKIFHLFFLFITFKFYSFQIFFTNTKQHLDSWCFIHTCYYRFSLLLSTFSQGLTEPTIRVCVMFLKKNLFF